MAQPLPVELTLALQRAPRRLMKYLFGRDVPTDPCAVPPVRCACGARGCCTLRASRCVLGSASQPRPAAVTSRALTHVTSQDLVRSPRAAHFIVSALLRLRTPAAQCVQQDGDAPAAPCAQQDVVVDDDVFAYLFKVRACTTRCSQLARVRLTAGRFPCAAHKTASSGCISHATACCGHCAGRA